MHCQFCSNQSQNWMNGNLFLYICHLLIHNIPSHESNNCSQHHSVISSIVLPHVDFINPPRLHGVVITYNQGTITKAVMHRADRLRLSKYFHILVVLCHYVIKVSYNATVSFGYSYRSISMVSILLYLYIEQQIWTCWQHHGFVVTIRTNVLCSWNVLPLEIKVRSLIKLYMDICNRTLFNA